MASKEAELLNLMTDGIISLKRRMAAFGKPRPLASTETATSWREVTIGTETFRVLTLEGKNDD